MTQAEQRKPTKRICIYAVGWKNRLVHAEEKSETRGTLQEEWREGWQKPGAGAKGHDEGIENKWVRDSAIFRWCRVFRPGDSALSSALRFHLFSIPSSSLDFIPRFSPVSSRYYRPFRFRRGVPLVIPVPCLSLYAPSARPESLVQQLGAGAPRESLVSGCALPLTASHRKPIETSRISPFGWTFAASLSLTWVTSTLPSSFSFLSNAQSLWTAWTLNRVGVIVSPL